MSALVLCDNCSVPIPEVMRAAGGALDGEYVMETSGVLNSEPLKGNLLPGGYKVTEGIKSVKLGSVPHAFNKTHL